MTASAARSAPRSARHAWGAVVTSAPPAGQASTSVRAPTPVCQTVGKAFIWTTVNLVSIHLDWSDLNLSGLVCS